MVLEVDLDHLVREAEHDGMTGAHPLLDVDHLRLLYRLLLRISDDLLVSTGLVSALEVRSEVLEQSYLFLELLRIFG